MSRFTTNTGRKLQLSPTKCILHLRRRQHSFIGEGCSEIARSQCRCPSSSHQLVPRTYKVTVAYRFARPLQRRAPTASPDRLPARPQIRRHLPGSRPANSHAGMHPPGRSLPATERIVAVACKIRSTRSDAQGKAQFSSEEENPVRREKAGTPMRSGTPTSLMAASLNLRAVCKSGVDAGRGAGARRRSCLYGDRPAPAYRGA